jgi:hypothetical protein
VFDSLKLRGAPPIFPPPEGARFIGACEGLRLYVRKAVSWTYYIIGPGDVLLAFNGFAYEEVAERRGVQKLAKLGRLVA